MKGIHKRLLLRLMSGFTAGRLEWKAEDGTLHLLAGRKEGPHAQIEIRNAAFYRKVLRYGDIGMGEAYMDGDFETADLVELLSFFIANYPHLPGRKSNPVVRFLVTLLKSGHRLQHLLRRNSIRNSRRNIEAHYDLGNEFYTTFLDETMTYSSGYYGEGISDLKEAQELKFERIAAMLHLHPGDHVLEIGCGWGGFSRYIHAKYGCKVTGITLSPSQLAWAREKAAEAGLGDSLRYELVDYRKMDGRYSKIVSVEMLEAVGHEYLGVFFENCNRLLEPDGLLALQVITMPDSRYEQYRKGVDFIRKYIFPGGHLPSIGALSLAGKDHGEWMIHRLESFGESYAETLKEWNRRVDLRQEEIRSMGYPERFLRMWKYYLNSCEAGFRMRHIEVVQLLFTRPNNAALNSLSRKSDAPLAERTRKSVDVGRR
jgi:cyclopropane-fatty-acyl-phospholipid synthase